MGRVGWASSRHDALIYVCDTPPAPTGGWEWFWEWLSGATAKQRATPREISVVSLTLSGLQPFPDDTAPGRYQRECIKKWQAWQQEDQEAVEASLHSFFTANHLEPGRETYISLWSQPGGPRRVDGLTNYAYQQGVPYLTLVERAVARKREEGWHVSLIRIAVRGYRRVHTSVRILSNNRPVCTVRREAPGDYLSAAVARNALFLTHLRGEGVWPELLYECDGSEEREIDVIRLDWSPLVQHTYDDITEQLLRINGL